VGVEANISLVGVIPSFSIVGGQANISLVGGLMYNIQVQHLCIIFILIRHSKRTSQSQCDKMSQVKIRHKIYMHFCNCCKNVTFFDARRFGVFCEWIKKF
jgi:hypothetical protein